MQQTARKSARTAIAMDLIHALAGESVSDTNLIIPHPAGVRMFGRQLGTPSPDNLAFAFLKATQAKPVARRRPS